MLKSIIALSFFILLAAPSFADFVEVRDLNIPIDNITELEIEAGAGSLEIVGYENLTKIEVRAEIELEGVRKSDGPKYIDNYITLELYARGSTARLEATTRDNSRGLFTLFSNRSEVINLLVKIPKNLKLDINDGSGDITIDNTTAGVMISDGSGGIMIDKIGGPLRISDGSGEIIINQVNGEIDLEDGSGSLEIRNITGDVEINDGSGDLIVQDVDGSVTVDDGSGDIEIDGVKKDVFIESSGSGGTSISNVDGRIDGDVEYSYYRRRHR